MNQKNKKPVFQRTRRKVNRMVGAALVGVALSAPRLGKRPRHRLDTAAAAERKEDRVAALDAKVFKWTARGREANIEVGRALNELKKILGHGKWQRHFAETFAPCGITLRTAENYMRKAREADSQIEKISIFKPATDPDATKIRDATKLAKEQVGAAIRHKTKPERIPLEGPALYRLPLHLTGDEQDATDQLLKSPNWPRAEEEIIALLKELHSKYG